MSGLVAVVAGVITLLVSNILPQSTIKGAYCQFTLYLANNKMITFDDASTLIGYHGGLTPDLSTTQGMITYFEQLVGTIAQYIELEQARNLAIVFIMSIFRDKHVTGGNLVNDEVRKSINTNEQAFLTVIGISLGTLIKDTNREVLDQFGIKVLFAYIKTSHAVSTSDEKLNTLKEIVAILRKIIVDYNGLSVSNILVNASNQIGIPSDFEILRVFIIVFHMVELQLRTPTELECTPFYDPLPHSSPPTVKVSGCTSCPTGTCSGCSSSSSSASGGGGGGAIKA